MSLLLWILALAGYAPVSSIEACEQFIGDPPAMIACSVSTDPEDGGADGSKEDGDEAGSKLPRKLSGPPVSKIWNGF